MPGRRQQRGWDVDVAYQRARCPSALYLAAPAHRQRHVQPAVVEVHLGSRERQAVIGGHDDQRVLQHPALFQQRHRLAQLLVVPLDLRIIGGEVFSGRFGIRQVRWHLDAGQLAVHPVAGVGVVDPVRFSAAEPEEERFGLVAIGQEVGEVGRVVPVVDASCDGRRMLPGVELLAVGVALHPGGTPVTRGPALAGEASAIPGVFQRMGDHRHIGRHGAIEHARLPGLPRVASRQQCRPRWGARRAHRKAMGEQHAFLGDPIENRGAHELVAIGAGVRPGLVIGDDEEQIRTFRSAAGTGERQRGRTR